LNTFIKFLSFGIFVLFQNGFAESLDSIATVQQLQQLEVRIQELKAQMQSTRTEYGQLQRLLQSSEEDIGEMAEGLEKLHNELSDKRNELKTLENKQKEQIKELNQQRQILAQQIRAIYMMGRQDYLKMWLNQQDLSTIGRVLGYYNYFNQARVQQIKIINTTLQRIDALKQEIREETVELDQLISSQDRKRQQYELSYSERQAVLAQLATVLEDQDRELKQLEEDKLHLKSLLGTLEDALKDVPQPQGRQIVFAKLKGQLPFPVRGKILKRFGEPLVGKLRWQGLLMSAEVGSKVQAVASGRVAFAEWFLTFGLLVIIDHGNGYMSLYAHNQSLYTKTGNWVEAGETIASVGKSGGREVPALYFEIRRQGIPVDPMQWLNR
jgi:septal ring factor EnvC (AmiA/AmiB activator)